jgi:hypothetical protein
MVWVTASRAWKKTFSQENDAVVGRCLMLDRRHSPDDECGNYETDKTRCCSPPTAKHNARTHAHQEHEQNRQTPAQ